MKTFSAKPADIQRRWYLVDVEGKVLGRVASQVAMILRNKRQEKFYAWHSGYPGGFKSIIAGKLLAQRPERVIEHAVKGMLPKNKLGRAMFKKLKVYGGPDHPHQAQQPQPLEAQEP
jgi:large subunit ribosomal protein L13